MKSIRESWEWLNQSKIRFMSDYNALNTLAKGATILEIRKHDTTRNGNIKGYKQDWEHVYRATGYSNVNGEKHKFNFIVTKGKDSNLLHVYSFHIEKE